VAKGIDNNKLKEDLERRRDEIVGFLKNLDTSWKAIQQEDVELEETASKRQLSLSMEKLDEQQNREIEAIDTALRRMETGDYGTCRDCGKPIPLDRLEAIPWTPICTRCARIQEKGPEGPVDTLKTREAEVPAEYEGISDDELEEAIYEELQNDGQVELDYLEIYVDNGRIHMEGGLPSEVSYQILISILQDTMGFRDIVDNVRIDEFLWQKVDRGTPPKTKKTEEEKMFHGDDVNEDVFDSRKSGRSVSPPENFLT
jgi:RNA polymerase-binding transcription factor DksA